MTPQITRHVGRIKNTGIRVVVVFRKLPDDDTQCLVVETDRLPDLYQDNVHQIVKSQEAQDTTELFEVLNQRKFGDNSNVLQTLHFKGFLRKVPVENVELCPLPNHILPLQVANNEIDNPTDIIADEVAALDALEKATTQEDKVALARSLMKQAELLESDAKNKREQALWLDPTLKPRRGRKRRTAAEKAAHEASMKSRASSRDGAKLAKNIKERSAKANKVETPKPIETPPAPTTATEKPTTTS